MRWIAACGLMLFLVGCVTERQITISAKPADATITIDGERWDSPEGGSRLIVQLAPGQHRIEVQKEGLRTYSSSVDIRPGVTQPLNVSLVRE